MVSTEVRSIIKIYDEADLFITLFYNMLTISLKVLRTDILIDALLHSKTIYFVFHSY